jgi:hypothetical protein
VAVLDHAAGRAGQAGGDIRCTHQLLQEAAHHLLVEEPLSVFGVDAVGRRPYLVGCQIGSSGLSRTNQRYSRL